MEWCTLPRIGAIKAILEEVGPRGDDSDSGVDNGRMRKVRSGIQLLKDAVGEIREKKHIKGFFDSFGNLNLFFKKLVLLSLIFSMLQLPIQTDIL